MLTPQTYHSDFGRDSHSSLDLWVSNRIRYEQVRVFGDGGTKESVSWPMEMGTFVEAFLLETESFKDRYAVDHKDDAKTKRVRKKDSDGRTLLTPAEMDLVYGICKGLVSHPTIERWVAGRGRVQWIVTWEDDETGLPLKVMVDKILDTAVVGDLKITEDVSPVKWLDIARKFGYARQQALYEDGLRANGINPRGFFFAVGSRETPDVAAAYLLPPEMVEQGREQNRRAIRSLAAARQANDWHLPKLKAGLYQLELNRGDR